MPGLVPSKSMRGKRNPPFPPLRKGGELDASIKRISIFDDLVKILIGQNTKMGDSSIKFLEIRREACSWYLYIVSIS